MSITAFHLSLLIFQAWLIGLTVQGSSMPADLAKRIREAGIDGTCIKPVPITEDVYNEIIQGPFPGDICGNIPCKIPYEDWYCAFCGGVWPYCVNTPFGNSTFCGWCVEQGCMRTEIPSNTSEDYPDYFEYVDYSAGAWQDPK